jgi:DNA-directed RNA polymerase subunit RPC12/RpoP
MTIDEFNEATSQFQRRMLWMFLLGALAVLLLGSLTSWVVQTSRLWLTVNFGGPATEIIVGLVPVPFVLAWFAVLFIWDRRAARDPRLRCPYCAKRLDESRRLVVATRNCPHCGRKVLKEPAPDVAWAALDE